MSDTTHKAEESLRIASRAQAQLDKELGRGGNSIQNASLVARNVLHEDLGYFGEPSTNYTLSEQEKNRLLAHARQDAALAAATAAGLEPQIQELRKQLARQRWTNLLVIVLLAVAMIGIFS